MFSILYYRSHINIDMNTWSPPNYSRYITDTMCCVAQFKLSVAQLTLCIIDHRRDFHILNLSAVLFISNILCTAILRCSKSVDPYSLVCRKYFSKEIIFVVNSPPHLNSTSITRSFRSTFNVIYTKLLSKSPATKITSITTTTTTKPATPLIF